MSRAADWKYANTDPVFPATRQQLHIMNLMRQFDGCNLWNENRMAQMEKQAACDHHHNGVGQYSPYKHAWKCDRCGHIRP